MAQAFGEILASPDTLMTIVSRNGAGDPTVIEWTASRSPVKKVQMTLTYDGGGDLATTQMAVVDI